MCTPECMIAMLGCPAFNEAVKAVIKAGKYARQYRMHVDNLRTELGHLEDARVRIERRVREARDRGEEIENAVTHWQADVGRMENDVQELSGQVEAIMHCFACSCPNIKLRYRLGKQAEEKIRDVHRLIEDSHFEQISHPRSPPPELEFPSAENYIHLASRTPIFEQIVVALKDPNVKMIGVHGLGGVGKTTLVEKVARKMLDDGTFKKIPLAVVSRVLNVKEIQKKLADNLNFRLDAPTDEKANQRQLWHKFRNGDNYLVILDDIWEVVDLITIGIPITDGKIGCKVVLTSRNKDLLEIRMKTDRNFPIAELEEGEAWDLFKKQVGNSMESQLGMESLAREVCKKCKGLPVAIKALGAALEHKPIYMWKTTLVKLERFMLTNIEGINSSVWATLRASYDMLVSLDAKFCFILCCLFPEDFEISIDELTRHCVVRSLLSQKPHTLEEARDATRSAVYVLKSTSLLSNGSNENVVRIHDVIRDVGISIAREEQAFLVEHGALQWPRNLVNEPSTISLNSVKIKELPDGLVYLQLHTLILDNKEISDLEVPDKFFSGMKQLTVLILNRIRMQRLPSSLAKLSNLRMLCLNQCKLADIAILGVRDLKTNLEVLSLRGSNIEALPLEMAQLTSLRVLDLRDCDDLKVIPQGIVSNLTNLEELYFADEFDNWEATIDEEKDTSRSKNVSIEEIRLLLNTGQLTTLHIHIPSVTLLPKEDLMLENLKGFRISMGSKFNWYEDFPETRVLKYAESSLRKEFRPLVDKAKTLCLSGIKGLKKVLDYRGVGNEFLDLKYLRVKSCDDDLEYLLGEPKSSVQSHELYPFKHLTDLIVEKCKLKYLFSPTTARGLVHLERLKVVSCENMEEIVGFEGQNDGNELILSKLKRMSLESLPNLGSFYAEKEKMRTPMESSSARAQPLFTEKVILPVLEELKVESLDSIEEIWDKQSPSVNQETVSFGQLRTMIVRQCKKLMNLVPSNILPRLQNLQDLRVASCPNVKFVVFKNGNEEEAANDSTLIIPRLTHLEIRNMEKLKSFYSSSTTSSAQSLFNHQVILPVLEELEVEELDSIEEIWDKQSPSVNKKTASFSQLTDVTVTKCEKLMNLGPWNILSRLRNLQRLTVDGCPNVEFIVLFKNGKGEEEVADDSTLIIPLLKHLHIEKMEKLKSFYSSSTTANAQSLFNHQVILPSLEVLKVQALDSIKEIWDKQSTSVIKKTASFSQLRDMTVKKCKELVNLGPANILPRLQNLQRLTVDSCPNVEVIVLFKNGKEEEAADERTFIIPQLRYLAIQNMEELKSFCSSSTTSNAQSLFNHQVILPVLEELKVESLDSIEEIWDKQSPSVNQETESFGQLRKIKVKRCTKLMNLGPSNILPRLRNLQFLKVEDCPNVEFVVFKNKKGEEEAVDDSNLIIPQLRDLRIWKMEKLKSFYSSSTTSNAQSLFNHQVAFPALEDLSIWEVPMIRDIWPQQPLLKPEKEVESFYKLKSISVGDCDQLEYVLPSYMLPQLHNLLQLKVYHCKELEVIVSNKLKEKEATNNDSLVFHQLNTLTLERLDKLKCFCTGTDQLLFSHKVAFLALEHLQIGNTPSITEIWDKKPLSEPAQEIESFSKLERISIWSCHQLVYVLPSYMLPRLQNLQIFRIRDCEEVEVIVSKELKEKEAADNDPIVFSQLKDVGFSSLPKLKSFYTGTQLIFSNKVAFPALEDLTVENVPKIKEIWDKQPLSEAEKEAISFCNLRRIDVQHCDQLVYVFPSSMLPQLQNLQKLVITNCKEMEVIISNKLKEKEATSNNIILFAELKTVILQFLPNLERLCSETQLNFSNKDAFPVLEINIEELTIERPWELKYLKTSGIAPNLMFLVNGTSTKEESGTSSKDEDSNDHDKEGEDGEEDVKNADDNKGVGGEEKDEDEEGGGGGRVD